MKKASRVIIVDKGKILFIHRLKNRKEYYVLPGGSVEEGESPPAAAIREIKEETNLDLILDSLLWEIEEEVYGEKRKGYYFLAKEFKGKLKLGYPESQRQSKENIYRFKWIPLEKIQEYLIYPRSIQEKIRKKFLKA